MNRIVRIERHRRGFFGWIFRLLFLSFNILMLLVISHSFYTAWRLSEDLANRDDIRVGATGAIGALLFIWIVGALFLGVLSYVTRGNKVIIEESREAR